MTEPQISASVHGASLRTRMLQGAGVAAALTVVNLLVRGVQLDVPSSMLVAFLAAIAICGAAGGATYYATDGLRARGGSDRTLANVASLLVYALLGFGMIVLALRFMSS